MSLPIARSAEGTASPIEPHRVCLGVGNRCTTGLRSSRSLEPGTRNLNPGWAQADNGAQAVQIFDSWASQLAPSDFDIFAGPYIKQIVDSVKATHPDLPLILYISGSGGLLERMAKVRGCEDYPKPCGPLTPYSLLRHKP